MDLISARFLQRTRMISGEDLSNLFQNGYFIKNDLIQPDEIAKALTLINFLIGKGFSQEDALGFQNNSKSLGDENEMNRNSMVTDLLHKTPIIEIVNNLLCPDQVFLPSYYTQIALRFPEIEKVPQRPWHIDNVTPGSVKTFNLLVGVFLSQLDLENAGNFIVYPGSHLFLQDCFRKDIESVYRHQEGRIITPKLQIEPKQILIKKGGVIFCHPLLAHSYSPNYSAEIRYAVYFRIYNNQLKFEFPSFHPLRDLSLTSIWALGWRGMKENVPRYFIFFFFLPLSFFRRISKKIPHTNL